MIPPVVASERGTAQTSGVARRGWCCRTATLYANREQNTLENVTIDGDIPVCSAISFTINVVILQPRLCRNIIPLRYSPFARHYFGNHYYFLFLQVLRCFSSLRSPPYLLIWIPLLRWVFPFGHLRVTGYLRLTAAFRSLSRPSSPP